MPRGGHMWRQYTAPRPPQHTARPHDYRGKFGGRTGSMVGSAGCSGGGRELLSRCEPPRSLFRRLPPRDCFACTQVHSRA